MSLKDALTNSLLMFVAATCVVLIVKALPQNGGNHAAKLSGDSFTMQNGVVACYMHGDVRCTDCQMMEEYAKEAVEKNFADELKSQKLEWQIINYDAPQNTHYREDFQIVAPCMVLIKLADGKQTDSKVLHVREYLGDKGVFVDFIQVNLREFLGGSPAVKPVKPTLTAPPAESQESPPLPE
jgi:hypothetical protein